MEIRSAECTKYAANAMFATRISCMNELSRLAEPLDRESVQRGIGSDACIGRHFLHSGCGYGSSCFPQDVQAQIILPTVHPVHEEKKLLLCKKIVGHSDSSGIGVRVVVWGLSCKPNTDDMREVPVQTINRTLIAHGVHICAYDLVATQVAQHHFQHAPHLDNNPRDSLSGQCTLIDYRVGGKFAVVELTTMYRHMKSVVIFDGHNVFDSYAAVCLGF